MLQNQPSLQQLLNKTADGEELTYDDVLSVKKHCQYLRKEYRAVLRECAEDESRVWSIEHSLQRFSAGDITVSECYNEVRIAYRELADRPRKERNFRAEIAFSMALTCLFSHTCQISRNRRLDLACTYELLLQMERTEQALQQYHRYQHSQARKRERQSLLQSAA